MHWGDLWSAIGTCFTILSTPLEMQSSVMQATWRNMELKSVKMSTSKKIPASIAGNIQMKNMKASPIVTTSMWEMFAKSTIFIQFGSLMTSQMWPFNVFWVAKKYQLYLHQVSWHFSDLDSLIWGWPSVLYTVEDCRYDSEFHDIMLFRGTLDADFHWTGEVTLCHPL